MQSVIDIETSNLCVHVSKLSILIPDFSYIFRVESLINMETYNLYVCVLIWCRVQLRYYIP